MEPIPRPLTAVPRTSKIAVAVCIATFGLLAAMIVMPFVGQLAGPLAGGGPLPAGWSVPSAVGAIVASLLALALLGASLYRRLYTRLNEDGIVVPAIGGARQVAWSDIERVSGRGMQIRLHTRDNKVVMVNPLCYASPREAMTYMLARLPRPTVPVGPDRL